MSQDYQTRRLNIDEGNLSGPICTSHNSHTHTRNTHQSEPQLKDFLCSSAIPSHNSRDVILSHNSRDVIPSHNSRNAMCLPSVPNHNSRDAVLSHNLKNNPTSQPLRYHQSIADHAYPKCINIMSLYYYLRCSKAARRNSVPDCLAETSCHQAPSVSEPIVHAGIAWRDNPRRQAPRVPISF